MVVPTAGLEGSLRGIAWNSASPLVRSIWAGITAAIPGSAARMRATPAWSAAGATTWSVPGAPGPKAAATCV